MLLMWALGLLVVVGLVAIVRWGALEVKPLWTDDDGRPSEGEAVRRFVWYFTVATTAGVAAGVVALGAGGRLAMRLLAVTAGEAAQGRVTEADELVGEITTGGTLGFIGFVGIAGGTLLAFAYVLMRRWLPRGRWNGLTFGVIMLLIAATRADPLRPENPDFDIVGPGWISVVVFSAVMVGYGMLVAAIAGRYSRWLPPLSKNWRVWTRYLPAFVVWGPAALVLGMVLIVGSVIAIVVAQVPRVTEVFRHERMLLIGRIAICAVVLAALPGFVIGIADIASRS